MHSVNISKRKEVTEALVEALNQLNELLPDDPTSKVNFVGDLENIIEMDENWQFVPNEQFISAGHIDIEFQEKINNQGTIIPVKQSNMSDIIYTNPEWEVIVRKHESKCDDLQVIVLNLQNSGLKITTGDLRDLINNGTALYEQAEQISKSNATIFRLPKAREKAIAEAVAELTGVIDETKRTIVQTLGIKSTHSLTIDAYSLKGGIVSISESWKAELKENHTIRETDERKRALELMANLESAINELNAFVEDNPRFGNGVTTSDDSRRSLIYLREKGEIVRCTENLEFV